MPPRSPLLPLLLAALLGASAPASPPEGGCFAVVAGGRCSADGAVLLGHNEDDPGDPVLYHWILPRGTHAPGTHIRLAGGGLLPEAPETWACLWSQMPGFHFSDAYLNEWGLAIASNSCPSREKEPRITGGGIGFLLRRLLAQRARSAREAVELAGRLLGEWGYSASGRTLILADPREAWLLCMVQGKHWVAVRVPDDRVCVVANSYPVHEIDLEAPGVLASEGLIEHALAQGWYEPEKEGPFEFAAAFADPQARLSAGNFERQRNARRLLGARPGPPGWKQPLFFEPGRPLGPADLFAVLRDRGETPGPDRGAGGAVCVSMTANSKVFQLRPRLPVGVGACLWLALGRPDASLFVPWHLGSLAAPAGYAVEDWRPAFGLTLSGERTALPRPPAQARYLELRDRLDRGDPGLCAAWLEARGRLEARWLAGQAELEEVASSLALSAPDQASALLTALALGRAQVGLETLAAVQSSRR